MALVELWWSIASDPMRRDSDASQAFCIGIQPMSFSSRTRAAGRRCVLLAYYASFISELSAHAIVESERSEEPTHVGELLVEQHLLDQATRESELVKACRFQDVGRERSAT
jgi:hypothetical protein